MDGRELSAPAAASGGAGGGHLGGARRSGGAAHVSARLRPMAEQLLAESGDNVLDVLLQLMEVRSEHIYRRVAGKNNRKSHCAKSLQS